MIYIVILNPSRPLANVGGALLGASWLDATAIACPSVRPSCRTLGTSEACLAIHVSPETRSADSPS